MIKNLKLKIKNYLTKLQNLPDDRKKIVLWTIVIILGLIMGFFWIKGAINSLNKIGESVSQIKLPEIQTQELPDALQTTTPSDQAVITETP